MRRVAVLVFALLLTGCAAPPAEEPEAQEPFEPVFFEHAFAQGAAASETFVVPEGARQYHVRLAFTSAAGDAEACRADASSPRIELLAPDGSTFMELVPEATIVSVGDGNACGDKSQDAVLQAGEWRVEFTGRGLVTGQVEVTQD